MPIITRLYINMTVTLTHAELVRVIRTVGSNTSSTRKLCWREDT